MVLVQLIWALFYLEFWLFWMIHHLNCCWRSPDRQIGDFEWPLIIWQSTGHKIVLRKMDSWPKMVKTLTRSFFLGYHTHARKQNSRRVSNIKDCDYKILVVQSKDQKFLSKFLFQILLN